MRSAECIVPLRTARFMPSPTSRGSIRRPAFPARPSSRGSFSRKAAWRRCRGRLLETTATSGSHLRRRAPISRRGCAASRSSSLLSAVGFGNEERDLGASLRPYASLSLEIKDERPEPRLVDRMLEGKVPAEGNDERTRRRYPDGELA